MWRVSISNFQYHLWIRKCFPSLHCPICERSSCEWSLTGPFSSDWATMSLSCGVCGWALGKGDLSAPGTAPESGGGIKLSGRMRRGGPGLLVERGSASPGGSKILPITGGSSTLAMSPAEGAARMVKGPPHCGQVVMSMAKTRLSNWAQLIRARGEVEGGSSSRLAMSVSGLASPGTICGVPKGHLFRTPGSPETK